MNDKQRALGAEVRAQAAARRITSKDLQTLTDVSSSAWSNYFNTCTRDVPMHVVIAVAEVFGMKGSELMRLAEIRLGPDLERSPEPDELEDGLTESGRRAVAEGRAEVAAKQRSSEAAKQRSSEAAKQRSSEAAKHSA